MRTEANGIEIGYDLSGEGPVLALGHALGLDRSMWFRQLPAFAPSHRVLAWDARGHGESTKAPGPYDFDLMARDLAGLLDALGIERAAVLGLSMGGAIAIAFASSYPQRTSALLLGDSTAWHGPAGEKALWDRIADVKKSGIEPLVPAQSERWFTDPFRVTHPEIVDRILGRLRTTDVQGYVATLEALATMDLRPRLATIRVPTLILVGSEDPVYPPAMAEQLHQGIQGSRLVVLEWAKHLAPVEQADAFNRDVLEFLARVGA